MSLRWLIATACLSSSCSKIYLDPVSIDAQAEPAAVMFLLDRSGSMATPLPNGLGCGACVFPSCDESTCPTRMGTVRTWASQMLGELGGLARWGLTVFPAANACEPAGANTVAVPIGAVGEGDVPAQVEAQVPGGGTPTAASLGFTGQTFPEGNAERIVLLVTDGLPDCNPQNPNTCEQPAACQCTLSAGCGTVVNDGDPNNFCRKGCLDESGAVDAVRSLTTFGVFTLVVGFGADVSGAGPLDRMAQAAFDGASCANDADCIGGRCVGGHCRGPALFATDGRSLGAVTAALKQKLTASARCRWTLAVELPDGPSAVYFGAAKVPQGDYVAETSSRVRFFGDSCQALVDDAGLIPTFFGEP